MDNLAMPELPKGWVWAELGEVCKTTSGGTPSRKKASYYGGNIPWIKSGELDYRIIYQSEESITEEGLSSSSAKVFPKGTLLIAIYGATVGKLGILGLDAATNQAVCAIFTPDFINTRFLYWFLFFRREELLDARVGGAQPNISQQILRQVRLPIPPLPEQQRIIAKIEELFTQLDAGAAALGRARLLLRRYRQAVLKAAVTGELTREWREEHRGEIEPAEVLLERILMERKITEKVEELEDMPVLPDSWCWVTINQVADQRLGKMLDKVKNKGKLRPYLRNINVRWFDFDLNDIQEMRVMEDEIENVSVKAGDLVVCEGGEPGRAAVWKNRDEQMIIQKALHRVRPFSGVLAQYIAFCLASDAISGRLEKYFTGSTIKHFTGESLRKYSFPLPSILEQKTIILQVEDSLSLIDNLNNVLRQEMDRSGHLHQSILKQAFSGKLVPQDTPDQPAAAFAEEAQAEIERINKVEIAQQLKLF